jgi:hypothetical protein
MKKNLTTLLLASFGMLMLCIQPALANHPLLQNGWLKAATANSVTIATPKGGGDVTFTLSEKPKSAFPGPMARWLICKLSPRRWARKGFL